MNYFRMCFLFLLVLLSLSSCVITDSITTIRFEILKPGIVQIPKDLNNVAVFRRGEYQSDSCISAYFDSNKRLVEKTTTNYSTLADKCVAAFAQSVENRGYFKNVKNYSDSLNHIIFEGDSLKNINELFEKTKSDICIFLDLLQFKNTSIYGYRQLNTQAHLLWTIAFKKDSSVYYYNQNDELIFDIPTMGPRSKKSGIKLILMDASEYLGRSFGSKLIPDWITVERMYYKSRNTEMLKAERFALKQEWLKAAEIWNRETKNKNEQIVAKACYNMALACEMEGKIDGAIDWLSKSYSALSKDDLLHKANCLRYIDVLAIRKKEIERLQKQVRNP